MATGRGLGIVTDGLVFYYDTGNSIDSYKGEPTVNLISGVANPTLSTSGWYSTGWNGNISIDTDEGALVLNATNGWRSMSYDFGITNGTVTVQFDYKLKSAEHTNIYMVVLNGTHLGSYTQALSDELSTGTIYPSLAEYKTFRKTFNTTTDSKICIVLRGSDNAGLTDEMFIKNLQVEQKSHATPFVNGTRSATQGLLDISGQGTSIDLSNLSFDSNAQMTFDGTDDNLDADLQFNYGNFSVEMVASWDSVSDLFCAGSGTAGDGLTGGTNFNAHMTTSGFYVRVYSPPGGPAGWNTSGTVSSPSSTNTTYHITVVNVGTVWYFYKNGTLAGSVDALYTPNSASTRVGIFRNHVQNVGNAGEVFLFKAYNLALTASEVKRNYDALKTRFGLI